MKKIIVLFVLFISGNLLALDVNLKTLNGEFKITHPEHDAVMFLTISKVGAIHLRDSNNSLLNCRGIMRITNKIATVRARCTNGMAMTQRIDLSNIADLDRFSAPLYISMLGKTIYLNFERL